MNMDDLRATDEELRASLDEGLLSLCLAILVYTQNPYRFSTFQWRMKARPRISTQAELADEQEGYGVLVAVVVAVAAFGVDGVGQARRGADPGLCRVELPGARRARRGLCTRARCYSSLLLIFPIGILHMDENGGGRMAEGPRLSRPRSACRCRRRWRAA